MNGVDSEQNYANKVNKKTITEGKQVGDVFIAHSGIHSVQAPSRGVCISHRPA